MTSPWNSYLTAGLAALAILVAAILSLVILPRRTEARLLKAGASAVEAITGGRESRRLIVEALGGLTLVVGLLFTLYQLQVSQRTLDGTERVQREARFTTALGQLGSTDQASQIAGTYALESSARADPYYAPVVDQTLAAFIRARSTCTPTAINCSAKVKTPDQPPDPAIQAALTVIGRVPQRSWMLNLAGANLSGQDLSNGNFEGANLVNADFTYATVTGTRFEGANLRGALTLLNAIDYQLAAFDEHTKRP